MPFLLDNAIKDKERKRLYQEPRKDSHSEKDTGWNRNASWNKTSRLKEATMSEEGEDIWQDLWENHWAGDREANS
jgi:hypothetical protein